MRQIIAKGLASIYTDVPTLRPGTIEVYALAFASAGVATAVRLVIDPYVMGADCLPFFPAVIITALIGGRAAGLFCVVLSAIALTFLQMPPLTFVLFVLLAIFIVILVTRMRLAIQREQAAQAIQASKDRLQFTLDVAKLGSWQYDPRRRVLKGDTRFKEIFDVTTDEMLIEDLKKLVHPGDAERFWADREASIDLADPMRAPSHEYRVQRRNDEIRWVEVRWFAYGDRHERGTASVVGIVHDITQRKQTEARLVEREAQLALFVEHSPAAIAMFDDRMRYLAVSRRFLSDYRLPAAADVIGRSHYEVFPDIPPRWREIHVRVLAGDELASEEDFFPRHDGRASWVRWSMKPWRTVTGQIGGAMLFVEVITEQVEARRALAESEARFRATFENAPVGIAHAAPDGRWLRVNEALCRIVGYPVDELLTKTFQDITHPDDLAAEVAQVELMCAGKIDGYDVDKRYIRKDGAVVWGRKTVSQVRKSDGSIDYFVSVVEDISARKAHEEQIHLLMREVNHRAKNILNLVQAIARQTAAREPEDFVARFTERIRALTASQDLLVRNEWRGVDVEELVRGQLAHFADIVASRIAMHGPKLRLNVVAAQAIGLALHELATNAGKYGALSTDRGRIDVCWGTEGDTLTMSWMEREGPPVSAPQRRGFGTIVTREMAERSVNGRVELGYAPSGVTWRLTCPAANALPA